MEHGRAGKVAGNLKILGFEEALELADAGRVAHLPQGLSLDLADAFACYFELAAHLLKRAAVTVH